MAVKPNHVIVDASDEEESAASFTESFDPPPPALFGPFLDVANEMTFAFLDDHGGRDLSLEDPSGHCLQIITRPYET